MMNRIYILVLGLLVALGTGAHAQSTDATITVQGDEVINDYYIGNGAQWDPYQLDYGSTKLEISEEDWEKMYRRLDFMRPQLMRVTINIGSYIRNGKLDPQADGGQLINILEYCNDNDVLVMFGDWGGGLVDSEHEIINKKNIAFAAELTDYLLNEKGFTESVKYFNIVNEPNGSWSATDGSYQLWARAVRYLHQQFEQRNITEQVSVVGPDVAIWTPRESWWVDSTATDLGDAVGLYDIHTYPSKVTVNSGEFGDIIKAYKDAVPAGKKIVMGEIGFKYVEEADSLFDNENKKRAEAKKYASTIDSQMFVYDYMYGTDMADALFQTVNSGYSGSVVWMLDDAMHSKEQPDKLKVWGFWNILGEEYFGAEEENVRPWYYAWSLLTKYMPAGSKVFKVDVSGGDKVKAIAVKKDGKYMVAMVNVSTEKQAVALKGTGLPKMKGVKKFIYAKGSLITEGDHLVRPNETGLMLDLSKGMQTAMPSESLIIYTNFSY